MLSKQTGLVFDQRFLAHDTGVEDKVVLRDSSFRLSPQPHPSSAVITQRIKEFLDGSGLTARMLPIPARAATEDELAVYHTREYIAGIRAYASGGPSQGNWGYADEDTILCSESYEAALYAAGGAMNAMSAVLEGRVHNVYALLRPPGHHATKNEALGFCVFNDAVIAVQHARTVYGLERVMIVDWDVHHGNGIQDAFYADPNVLFVSLHQQDWFPKRSGELDQVGVGGGIGFTVNIPLPPGTGDRGYCATFERIVLPIGRQFQPQCIVIIAGHDASWLDPLARMMVTMDGYSRMSTMMVDLAEELCDGRLVMLQAGGYSASYVPYCAVASVEALVNSDLLQYPPTDRGNKEKLTPYLPPADVGNPNRMMPNMSSSHRACPDGFALGIVDLYATANELERCQTIFSQETQNALHIAVEWHRKWWKL